MYSKITLASQSISSDDTYFENDVKSIANKLLKDRTFLTTEENFRLYILDEYFSVVRLRFDGLHCQTEIPNFSKSMFNCKAKEIEQILIHSRKISTINAFGNKRKTKLLISNKTNNYKNYKISSKLTRLTNVLKREQDG